MDAGDAPQTTNATTPCHCTHSQQGRRPWRRPASASQRDPQSSWWGLGVPAPSSVGRSHTRDLHNAEVRAKWEGGALNTIYSGLPTAAGQSTFPYHPPEEELRYRLRLSLLLSLLRSLDRERRLSRRSRDLRGRMEGPIGPGMIICSSWKWQNISRREAVIADGSSWASIQFKATPGSAKLTWTVASGRRLSYLCSCFWTISGGGPGSCCGKIYDAQGGVHEEWVRVPHLNTCTKPRRAPSMHCEGGMWRPQI